MNILLINYEYPPIGGGAGNACSFLGKALYKKGHQVVILTSAFESDKGYSVDDGCHLYRINTPRKSPSQANSFEMMSFVFNAFFHLKKIVKKHKISHSIIYFSIPCGPLGTYMRWRWGIPYINSLRGGDVPGLVEDLNTIHKIITPIRRKILASSIITIANAEGLANLSRKADPQPVEVIPNGVDPHFYCPSKNQRTITKEFIFVFVGRFHDQKNLFYLLDQFKKTLKDFPSCKLHMVGDGSLNKKIQLFSKKISVDDSIFWHGWMKKKELQSLYQESDCMINPSHYEGLPNSVLEGMACALPVIVSDVSGNNNLIFDNDNGYLFDLSDSEGLYNCMLKILHHPNSKKLGEQGRKRVIEHHSWDRVAEAYSQCLERVPHETTL